MTMSLHRPSAVGTRPAYLDNLFRDIAATPSIHSSTSSISNASTASNYDLRSAYHASRPLSPPVEEDRSDTFSVRSKKSFLPPRRFKLGSLINRRTYPQSEDRDLERPATHAGRPTPQSAPSSPPAPVSPQPSSPPPSNNSSSDVSTTGRRPSLPKIQTNFPPPEAISTYSKKPLPPVPGQQPKREVVRPKLSRQQSNTSGVELNCQRCYYYAARNCNGWVLGGEPGDACEMCLQSGYFGAK